MHRKKDNYEKNKNKLILPDQDIISALYGNRIKLVDPLKYNLGDRTLNIYNSNHLKDIKTIDWVINNTVIIHYFGRNKPWKKGYIGKLGIFYYHYLKEL